MNVMLDNYTLPETGLVEVRVAFEIKVSAEEARKKVNRWLHDEVSMLISADPPTLVVGEHTVWRVPAYISFPDLGRVGDVGAVTVSASTGEMMGLPERRAEIERRLEQEIKPRLPLYKRKKRKVPPEFIPTPVPPVLAPVAPDDELVQTAT